MSSIFNIMIQDITISEADFCTDPSSEPVSATLPAFNRIHGKNCSIEKWGIKSSSKLSRLLFDEDWGEEGNLDQEVACERKKVSTSEFKIDEDDKSAIDFFIGKNEIENFESKGKNEFLCLSMKKIQSCKDEAKSPIVLLKTIKKLDHFHIAATPKPSGKLMKFKDNLSKTKKAKLCFVEKFLI